MPRGRTQSGAKRNFGKGIGGADGDRTHDLQIANLALSRLSYCPTQPSMLAERVGFEPTVAFCATHDFQSCTFGHSVTSPMLRLAAATRLPPLSGSSRYSVQSISGEGGIRTHGDLKATTVFETAPFVHSGTSPKSVTPFTPSQPPEKAVEKGAAFRLQHAPAHLAGMVQAGVPENIPCTSTCAGFRIESSENQPRNPCQHQSSGAHGAGFQRYIQHRIAKMSGTDRGDRLADGDDLGMGGRIASRYDAVGTSTDDPVAADEHGTHGNLGNTRRRFRQLDGLLHPVPIEPVLLSCFRRHRSTAPSHCRAGGEAGRRLPKRGKYNRTCDWFQQHPEFSRGPPLPA